MNLNPYKYIFICISQKKQWKDNPKGMKMVVIEEEWEQAREKELKLP